MSTKTYFLQLIMTIGISAAVLISLHLLPEVAPYWKLSVASVIFFALLTLLIFLIAKRAVQSPDPNTFTRISLLFVFVKLVAALAFIVLYDQLIEPKTRWFVLPFLLVYVLFTIFEVIFMMALSREKV